METTMQQPVEDKGMSTTSFEPMEDDFPVDHDEKVLLSLGYKQEFKREFSLWTSFCVSFAVLGLLPSFASTLFYGMGYAGTAGLFLFSSSNNIVGVVTEYWANFNLPSRNGLGMDNCHDLYPMRCPELG
jgi:hypothetical protein